MKSVVKGAMAGVLLAGIWAVNPVAAQSRPNGPMVADGAPVIGAPFIVDGVTYTPSDPTYYDEVGYAEPLSATAGVDTASGEVFAPMGVSAAHKTLPLPSYVEVTSIESGRTILVRVNDRGPMRGDRLIALSPGAWAQLGVTGDSIIPVRVRRVNPPDQDMAILRSGARAAERLETPPALLKALRVKLPPMRGEAKARGAAASAAKVSKAKAGVDFATPPVAVVKPRAVAAPVSAVPATAGTAPPTENGGYVVQIGAYSSKARADAVAARAGASVVPAVNLYRVRSGPYPTRQAAEAGVRAAASQGFDNARIMANDGQ